MTKPIEMCPQDAYLELLDHKPFGSRREFLIETVLKSPMWSYHTFSRCDMTEPERQRLIQSFIQDKGYAHVALGNKNLLDEEHEVLMQSRYELA